MSGRTVRVLRPRNDAAIVRLPVALAYLRGEPIEDVELTPDAALDLACELVAAARRTLRGAR